MMTRRIVVLRSGALGDIILTLPAVRVLRCEHPTASIEAVGYPDVWRVAGPMVDGVVRIDAPMFAGLYSGSLTSELRTWLEGVDLIIAWTVQDPRSVLEAAGVPTVIYASPYPPPGMHATEWLLSTLPTGRAWIQSVQARRLSLSQEELTEARAALARIGVAHPIILHPGAGSREKRWPADRFATLATELMRRDHQVALVEGPADGEVVADVQQRVMSLLPVVRDLDTRRLAAVLAQARCFVGNDSGVTHLAAAVGAPTLALFGPTDPTSWAPLGNARVLRVCRAHAVHQGQILVCDDPACMEAISVHRALAELASLGC